MKIALALLALAAPALSMAQASVSNSSVESPAQVANELVRAAYAIETADQAATESYAKSFEDSFRAGMAQKPNGSLILAQNSDAIAAGMAAVRSEFRSQYRSFIAPEVTRAVAEIYERTFDLKDLVAIRAHYASPQAQAFLTSFKTNPAGAPADDPIVLRFRYSKVGRKEIELSQQIAAVLASANVQASRDVAPKVIEKFQTALERVKAARRHPK